MTWPPLRWSQRGPVLMPGRVPTTRVRRGAANLTLLEMPGIEPGSFGGNAGLLRVQLAVVFSAPPFTRARRCRAQSLLGFPPGPVTGPSGDPPVDARSRAGGAPGLTATR